MNDLEWREIPGGYECRGYRIRLLDGSPPLRWSLELSDPFSAGRARRARYPSIHTSLRGAKSRASRAERDRLRRARTVGHVVIGLTTLGVFAALVPYMSNLVGFVAAMGAVYVAVRSFTFAVSIRLGDPWGWTRDHGEPERITWSDRALLALMEGTRRRTIAAATVDPASAVQELPPEPIE